MSWKQITLLIIIMILTSDLVFKTGYEAGAKKQEKINNQLRTEYNELKTNYDNLKTEYKWQLESCYQQLGDLQDRIEID